MSDFKLAFTYLRSRMLVTVLTVLSVALGLGLATIVLILSRQAMATLSTETAYWDVVIGAKGSPLQLVLSGLYYLEAPTGNIDEALWHTLEKDPGIARVVPVNMGDTYFGVPIVGTVPRYFEDRQPLRGHNLLAQGRLFAKPFEVTVGADIAARYRLTLGRQIVSSHGWSNGGDLHPEFPYTVVGILAPTGASLDRAIYTDYHSTWEVHAHHHHHDAAGAGRHDDDDDDHAAPGAGKQITTLLVQMTQPGRRYSFVETINAHQHAMAVIPVDEVDKLRKTFIDPMQHILLVVAYLVVIVSALSPSSSACT